MPSAVRLGDVCDGACGEPPASASSGSSNVFINGRPAVRVGDTYTPHGSPPHSRVVTSGSPNVFVNGKPLARIGDDLSCGSHTATGSSNVFVNG